MSNTYTRTESIVDLINKKIEHIIFRIKTIQNTYKQINNESLRERLINEHENLKYKFIAFKPIILLLENSSSDNIKISKFLTEKYLRHEREIFNNKFLFST